MSESDSWFSAIDDSLLESVIGGSAKKAPTKKPPKGASASRAKKSGSKKTAGVAGGSGKKKGSDAKQRQLKQLEATINRSPTGRKELREFKKDGGKIKLDGKSGASYLPDKKPIIRMGPGYQKAKSLAHELGHHDSAPAQNKAEKASLNDRNKARGKANFITTKIKGEVKAEQMAIKIGKENGTLHESRRLKERAARLDRDTKKHGATVAFNKEVERYANSRTSTTGDKYKDHYGKTYDRLRA